MSDTQPKPSTFRNFAKDKPAAATPPSAPAKETRAVTSFGASTGAGLGRFLTVAEEAPAFDLFPLVIVTGGNTGGMFDTTKSASAELKQILPAGRKPVPAVVLAYRLQLTSFPHGYEEGGDSPRPAWSCAIPSSNEELFDLASRFTKNYQFTKKANKVKFNVEDSNNIGHCRPAVSLLVWLAEQNLLVEVRCAAGYGSTEKSLRELAQHVTQNPDGSSVLEAFPCELAVLTEVAGEKTANPWKEHSLQFKSVTNDAKAVMGTKFQAWAKAASEDDELKTKYDQWVSGSDKEVTPEILDAITRGVSL